jgi:hypothetical protein
MDEQTAFVAPPLGQHLARLTTCAGDPSKKGDQMVTATFEIVLGEHAGKEVRIYRVTTPKWDQKKGRWNSRGVAEIKADLVAAQAPPPPGFQFPTRGPDAARIYAQGLANKTLVLLVYEEQRKDPKDGTTRKDTRTKIVGLPEAVGSVAAAGGSPQDIFR